MHAQRVQTSRARAWPSLAASRVPIACSGSAAAAHSSESVPPTPLPQTRRERSDSARSLAKSASLPHACVVQRTPPEPTPRALLPRPVPPNHSKPAALQLLRLAPAPAPHRACHQCPHPTGAPPAPALTNRVIYGYFFASLAGSPPSATSLRYASGQSPSTFWPRMTHVGKPWMSASVHAFAMLEGPL